MDPNRISIESLAARVAELEARGRRWKLATGVFILLSSAVVLMAAKPADRIEPPLVRARSVEAREFLLKDATGRVYARLSLNEDRKRLGSRAFGHFSQAVLDFYDEQGDVTWSVPAEPSIVPAK
jgi:hypothetical protein